MRFFIILCILTPTLAFAQLDETWIDFSIGSPALKLKLPGQPSPQNPSIPPSVRAYFKQYDAYYLKDKPRGLVITLMAIRYNDDITADGRGAINGTNGQWEQTGMQVAILSTVDKKVSGKNAVYQRGNLIQGEKQHEFMDIVITEGNKMWQIIIMADKKKPELRDDLQQIAESLTF
jgi:hypothetical protein